MSRPLVISLSVLGGLLLLAVAAPFILFYGARWYYEPTLPSVASLRELKLQVPLRVYTRDGRLIGEFGAERRAPMAYADIPQHVIDSFLAAEDDRFFEHPGVDWQGLARATLKLMTTGEKSQGGSTITMQLARNVFLSSERSYERKIREILLALRIEREMTKKEILQTYLNKIFLGQRAYGVGAASRVYFAREPAELSWAQTALLAGLPKAPSRDNPVIAPARAKDRRDYVLRRLRQLNKISELDYQAALAEPVLVKLAPPQVEADAHFVAEMVRADVVSRYGDTAYTSGFRVTSTVLSARQEAANNALRSSLLAYDERHGWRGAEARLPPDLLTENGEKREAIEEILSQRPQVAGLRAAAVVSFRPERMTVLMQGLRVADLTLEDFKWAQLSGRKALHPGDIVRVRSVDDRWRLSQVPEVQGALASMNPRTGAIEAVVGGYDFLLNKYNRATQARRQPGSGFKPFLYAAAFDRGFTPATVMLDAPIVYRDSEIEGAWRPENYDGDFKGPMRLREALVYSRNLVTIRLLQAVGVDTARSYITRFGLSKERIPRDLSMALGTGSFSPMEMATAYSVLANGGYRVDPYVIENIADANGKIVYQAHPASVCDDCKLEPDAPEAQGVSLESGAVEPPRNAPRVVDARVVWLVDDLLREVVVRGTAAQARKLGRADIAGKTGTTNDETDAWFSGFNGDLVSVVWIGFDQPAPLGRGEVGGRAALPMWMDYMREALKDVPETERPRPPGLVDIRIDRNTGMLAAGGDPDAIMEVVQDDHVPASGNQSGYGDEVPLEELY